MANRGKLAPAKKRPDFSQWIIAIACALAIAPTALFLAALPMMPRLAESRDFIVYWSTGQQLVHHADPYNANAMGSIEHATAFRAKGSYYMRNPPWGLWLAWPLGLLSARAAALPWSLLMLALLIASVQLLARMSMHAGGTLSPLHTSSRALLAVLALIYIAIGIETFYFQWGPAVLYLWPAPAWLVWYLLARNSDHAAAVSPSPGMPAPSVG
jgi:hypothetical protein